jgi:hypothetical protein
MYIHIYTYIYIYIYVYIYIPISMEKAPPPLDTCSNTDANKGPTILRFTGSLTISSGTNPNMTNLYV